MENVSSTATNTINSNNITHQNTLVADEQLDAQEIYSAEKQAEKYHENLAEISAEVSRGPVKDKMARLALILAQKNLAI